MLIILHMNHHAYFFSSVNEDTLASLCLQLFISCSLSASSLLQKGQKAKTTTCMLVCAYHICICASACVCGGGGVRCFSIVNVCTYMYTVLWLHVAIHWLGMDRACS